MSDYKRLQPTRCMWCGYEMSQYDQWSGDHWLWCGSKPRDATTKEQQP